MNKKSMMMAALAAATLTLGCTSEDNVAKKTIDRETTMSQLSLEDKAHFVIGTGMSGFGGDDAVIGATRAIVPGAAGTTYPLDSLGIPAIVLADGPAGLRIDAQREGDSASYYCTHFPIGTLLASTWNTQLIEEVGTAIGEEMKDEVVHRTMNAKNHLDTSWNVQDLFANPQAGNPAGNLAMRDI